MNTEDSEFERIEAEAKRRAQADDDDTQEYVAQRAWVGLTDKEANLLWENTDDRDSWELIKRVEAKLKKKNT